MGNAVLMDIYHVNPYLYDKLEDKIRSLIDKYSQYSSFIPFDFETYLTNGMEFLRLGNFDLTEFALEVNINFK